jgi:hypothetical protein
VDGDQVAMGDHRIRLGSAAAQLPGRTELAEGSTERRGRPTRSTPQTPASFSPDGRDATPRRVDPSGMADPAAARLLDEFDRMHRRTIGQFQQAILMMYRKHQDQMDLIRNELCLSGPDQHARLAQRLLEIEDERQGLWKKLLSALWGDGPENGLR